MIKKFIAKFIEIESSSGVLMIIAALLALAIVNSPIHYLYHDILHFSLKLEFNNFAIGGKFHEIVNELLMFWFFMLVGLEIKRELCQGELSNKNQRTLPLIATIAGVIFPALMFTFFNANHGHNMKGWAIPIVTDIAFALCILSFFKSNVPNYLRIFLLSLAIFDDLIGILVIALFYSANLHLDFLCLAAITTIIMIYCNNKNLASLKIYLFLGCILWFLILKSGIHATIAGVITALIIPYNNNNISQKLMEKLHPWVNYLILPIFAFTNAGVELSHFSWQQLTQPLTMGIILGLFLGKQTGVFLSSLLLLKAKIIKLPQNISLLQLYGVSVLTGIGFTVSLFIQDLAFTDPLYSSQAKIAILLGSTLSAVWGYFILKTSSYFKTKPKS